MAPANRATRVLTNVAPAQLCPGVGFSASGRLGSWQWLVESEERNGAVQSPTLQGDSDIPFLRVQYRPDVSIDWLVGPGLWQRRNVPSRST